jgi:putative spermidine/putrescine transport system ATP-binding protein
VAQSKIKLRVRGAAKSYGAVTALAGASFEMGEGEFLTLLGPSGSGKTTLLMIIAGLMAPDGGEVWIDGRLATYAPPHKRDIGIVFQNYALFPHLTVFENIAFPLRMRRMAKDRIANEVMQALDTVQLAHTANRLPRELSGGQQQRIALARCTVYRPSIVLMDEPLGALDRKLRDQMQLEIKHLQRQIGITVLYVTHDQDEAMTMSDRICLMNNGRIEQLGAPQELYFRPRSVFVADFLGESNLLSGIVRESGERLLVEGPGRLMLSAMADGTLAIGTKVRLMVRPESLRLLAPGEAGENAAEGTLEEIVFTGGVRRYYVAIPGEAVLAVKELTDKAAARNVGDAVRVGWEAAATIALPEQGGAAS